MIIVETSHLPSADDITFESLEYLFAPANTGDSTPVPWVEIMSEAVSEDKQLSEVKGQLALLEKQYQSNQIQLQRVCILIGYMQGLLHERDEQLKAIPDLRFRAAESVALRLEVERSKETIQELEEEIERHNQHSNSNLGKMLKALMSPIAAEEKTINTLMWLGFFALTAILYLLVT